MLHHLIRQRNLLEKTIKKCQEKQCNAEDGPLKESKSIAERLNNKKIILPNLAFKNLNVNSLMLE